MEEIGEIAERNAKRIHIPKTVELADFAEKNPNRMRILRVLEGSKVVLRPSESKPLQCSALLICKSQGKRNYHASLYYRMFCKFFHSQNKALCDLLVVYQLHEQMVSEASETSRFQKSPKNMSKISRWSTEKRMTKRMGFRRSLIQALRSVPFLEEPKRIRQ